MDEKNNKNKEFDNGKNLQTTDSSSSQTAVETKEQGNFLKTAETIFSSPEGSFLGFSITLLFGYMLHALTSNKYHTKIKTKNGTEISIEKTESLNK